MTRLTLTISEFADLEYAVGALETDGTEEFSIGRFEDGELGFSVTRAGERSSFCRLTDWIAQSANR